MTTHKSLSDEDLPALCPNESDSDDEGWEETEEDEEMYDNCQCLFCEDTFKSLEVAIRHLDERHHVNLAELKTRFLMDQYSYLMLVNYIRKHSLGPEAVAGATTMFWNDEQYLKPVREQDSGWLCYDFDSIVVDSNSTSNNEAQQLKLTIDMLKKQLQEKDQLLEYARTDIETMKKSFNHLINKEDSKVREKAKFDDNCVGGRDLASDEGYFYSYSHFGIHRDMLNDKVRTDSYRDAIQKNSELLKDKVVLDCGCGTGILSMFASKAGAAEVLAIDQSDIIYQAMDIARINEITNIKFIKGRLEDTVLPVDKVDVIISEWMGYFLLFEGMLDSVIYARDRYLKPGGVLMPNRCTISLAGYGDEVGHQSCIHFWDNVYGFDYSCLKKDVLKEAVIEDLPGEHVLTDPVVILNLDLMTCAVFQGFSYDFSLRVRKAGKLTSFVGYFDTFFDLPNAVAFSTSPFDPATHWKQINFYLERPVEFQENDMITGKFVCKRDRKDVRSLNISIEVFGRVFNYCLN